MNVLTILNLSLCLLTLTVVIIDDIKFKYKYMKKAENNASQDIILIAAVAVDDNWGIAKNGEMPWHLKEDLEFFKNTTIGNVVIMGRKTYETIGKPLKDRTNIVISSNFKNVTKYPNPEYDPNTRLFTAYSIENAIQIAKRYNRKIFVIGGEMVYNEALMYCNKAIITKIHGVKFGCDQFFPDLHNTEFEPFHEHLPEYDYIDESGKHHIVTYCYYANKFT